MEIQDAEGCLGDTDIAKLSSAYNLHSALLRQISLKWQSKSRLNWLLNGDLNTSFFHRVTRVVVIKSISLSMASILLLRLIYIMSFPTFILSFGPRMLLSVLMISLLLVFLSFRKRPLLLLRLLSLFLKFGMLYVTCLRVKLLGKYRMDFIRSSIYAAGLLGVS